MALGENHTSQFSQQQEEKEAQTLHLQGAAARPQVNAQQQQLMVGVDIESSCGQHSSNSNGLTHHHDGDDDAMEVNTQLTRSGIAAPCQPLNG